MRVIVYQVRQEYRTRPPEMSGVRLAAQFDGRQAPGPEAGPVGVHLVFTLLFVASMRSEAKGEHEVRPYGRSLSASGRCPQG